MTPGHARYAALLTPQGKIIVDFIVAEAPAEDGGGFFLDVARARWRRRWSQRLNFYKLRAKVIVEDLSDVLGVLAAWDGSRRDRIRPVLSRSAAAGRWACAACCRRISPDRPIADLGADLVDAAEYEAHRIALGVPRGGLDFSYGDAFPHEADMDQLAGVDFDKGCFVGQEVVSRMAAPRHRAQARGAGRLSTARRPPDGAPVTAGDKSVGTMGSTADGHGLAMLRLDRAAEALAAGRAAARRRRRASPRQAVLGALCVSGRRPRRANGRESPMSSRTRTELFSDPVDVVDRRGLKPHVRPSAESDAIYAF